MHHKKILRMLCVTVAAVCVLLSVNLFLLLRKSTVFPQKAVEDIVRILAEASITMDPGDVSARREKGTVYVCNSPEYNRTVAELLGGGKTKAAYIIPDGEILVLDTGARFTFGEDFSFRFQRDGGADSRIPEQVDLSQTTAPVSREKKEEIARIAVDFLDRGSREFANAEKFNLATRADTVWENGGLYYALCTRTMDGVAVTENTALCAVDGGGVCEAYGSWSFLTLGDSYSAQLSDLFNILYHMKQDIGSMAAELGGVTILAVEQCYALYFYGGEGNFCLIPCWSIQTDQLGSWIYNAIDGTLYTKN